jgi:4-hydroxy-2-oxoglutarate aldolase
LSVVQEIIAAAPKQFQTLVGSAAIIEPSLKLGAVGAILALADVVPDLCVELYEAALFGNSARAQEIQKQIAPVAQKCVSELGIAGVKFAMDRLGMFGGPVRSPLLPLNEEKRAAVISALATLHVPAAH